MVRFTSTYVGHKIPSRVHELNGVYGSMVTPRANRALLAHLSKRIFLTVEDLDKLRELWGTKIAFYFAVLQTYFRSPAFPCVAGIFAWAFLPKYSLFFSLVIGIWCTVFLEYWKIKQTDLALRWDVRGIDSLKINRPQFRYETETVDAVGRVRHHFPRWKRIPRQLVVVPFVLVSTLLLGVLIALVFVIETFINEAYEGPYKFYLVCIHQALTLEASRRLMSIRSIYQRFYSPSSCHMLRICSKISPRP